MFLGKVVGTVWSTKKVDNLRNLRLLLIHPVNLKVKTNEDLVVVADVVGAGVGELVICAYGHAARMAIGNNPDISVEAAVVGIVDELEASPEFLSVIPGEPGNAAADAEGGK
ncbi:MAG: ethanolamine utilization protein EutN [Calditrichaeota bacterium]|nr:ethanolamine utilization protein EutN [Candidatus Cloacimonadota bacterium]MCB1046443.1 ethanolamine utilization protein EutN [Calditrichota bacterium]